MVKTILVILGLIFFVCLLAACATASRRTDESDIELWIREHDRLERQKGEGHHDK